MQTKGMFEVTSRGSRETLKFSFEGIGRQKEAKRPSILVVEADDQLRRTRAMLLETLRVPVDMAAGYAELSEMDGSQTYGLVAISLHPCQHEAERMAAFCRRQWKGAKVLLLGRLHGEFYDALYDEVLDAAFDPGGLIETSRALLSAFAGSAAWLRGSD